MSHGGKEAPLAPGYTLSLPLLTPPASFLPCPAHCRAPFPLFLHTPYIQRNKAAVERFIGECGQQETPDALEFVDCLFQSLCGQQRPGVHLQKQPTENTSPPLPKLTSPSIVAGLSTNMEWWSGRVSRVHTPPHPHPPSFSLR